MKNSLVGKKLILSDIDGVLTNGCVTLDTTGKETKTLCYRDLDSIGIGRAAGYEFIFITGEDTEMARFIVKRFGVKWAYYGAKDKLAVLQQIATELECPLTNFVYIGDSDRDAPAIAAVGLGVAPADATIKARESAQVITEKDGGTGVLLEIVHKLINGKLTIQV